MKKLLYLTSIALCAIFTSCDKDEIGGTATEALAGQWYVVCDGVDENGEITMEDPFDVGRTLLLTYNTSENTPNEIFVDDLGNFWEYKVKANSNISNLTFSASEATDYYNGIAVDITDGIE